MNKVVTLALLVSLPVGPTALYAQHGRSFHGGGGGNRGGFGDGMPTIT